MSPLITHLPSQDFTPMPDLSTRQYGTGILCKSESYRRNSVAGKPFS